MNPSAPVRAIAVFMAGLSLSGCITFNHPKDHWLGLDKVGHFTTFGALGAAAAAAALHHDESDNNAFMIGVGTAVGLGSVKEYVDEKPLHKYFSGKDLIADLAGGIVGSLIVIQAD
ncbi:MAG TPA: hypothetical protein P5567_06770 [Kiritimatiellia bacterium]|nr:hypothetical protein [Kiritimatiellia bacterium]HRZ12140.1 hypothetical protein [Kiritimatiellia bacterium]HSA18102.1 hypothetical protein [Kiritimatiellia bacterium]